jgi:hypothetical protein
MTSPVKIEKRTSAAEAVKGAATYGTAEPVPFVRLSLPKPSGAVQIGQPKNLSIGRFWRNLAQHGSPQRTPGTEIWSWVRIAVLEFFHRKIL